MNLYNIKVFIFIVLMLSKMLYVYMYYIHILGVKNKNLKGYTIKNI